MNQQRYFQKEFRQASETLNAELAAGWRVIPETFKVLTGITVKAKSDTGDVTTRMATFVSCILERECPAE